MVETRGGKRKSGDGGVSRDERANAMTNDHKSKCDNEAAVKMG